MKIMKLLPICLLLPTCAVLYSCAKITADPVSVTVEWTAPGDDGDVGTADRYDMVYTTDSTDLANAVFDFSGCSSCTFVTGLPAPLIAGTTQEVTISGLVPNERYWVAMRAGDEVPNWSSISNIIGFDTPDSDAPARINDLRVKP